ERFQRRASRWGSWMFGLFAALRAFSQGTPSSNPVAGNASAPALPPARRAYSDFALRNEGNAARGRDLFGKDARIICIKCHSIDGSSDKAGPDLSAVGDKFPRRELIDAILKPSAAIAVGYGTTVVETKSGEPYQGVIKGASSEAIELMGADGNLVRIA